MDNATIIKIIILSVFGIFFIVTLLSLPKYLIKNRSDIKNYDTVIETFTTKITSKVITKENGNKVFKLYIRTPENTPIIFKVPKHQYRSLQKGDIVHYKKITYINKENSLLKEYEYKIIKSRLS